MGTRILFAIFAIPLFVGALYKGGIVCLFLFLLLSLMGISELFNITHQFQLEFTRLQRLSVYLFAGLLFYSCTMGTFEQALLILYLYFLGMGISILKSRECKKSFFKLSSGLLMLVYCSSFFALMVRLRNFDDGFRISLFWIICIWITDSAAYFWGRFLGKEKMLPSVSPNKTLVGFIGGLFTPGIIYVLVLRFSENPSVVFPAVFQDKMVMFGVCFFISLLAQIGDLLESALKRDAEIKDSSGIFPGHGGVLDRFDSMLFTIVPYYWLINQLILN